MGPSSLGLPPTPPTLPTAVPCPGARWWPAQCSSPGHPVLAALSHLKLLVPQVGTRVSCVVIHRHERPGEESESPACGPSQGHSKARPCLLVQLSASARALCCLFSFSRICDFHWEFCPLAPRPSANVQCSTAHAGRDVPPRETACVRHAPLRHRLGRQWPRVPC